MLDQAPVTLVHGDISHRNVKMVQTAEGLQPMVFDWETGGLGNPMIDLAWVDLAAYEDAAPATWSAIDRAALRRMQTLGVVTWVAYVLLGERANLASPWPDRAAAKIPAYLALVEEDRLDELVAVSVGR
jgi:aminoglycoside phosphotransferase (APT) family kinase protein